MLADAADEGYLLTAFCDDEEADTYVAADEVTAFVEHCDYLFAQGQRVDCHGFTAFALDQLQTPRVLNVGKAMGLCMCAYCHM